MTSLPDFILARVSDDEAAARGAGSFTPWDQDFRQDNYGHLTIQPARVLADCAARRAIVDLHDVAHYCSTGSLQDPVGPPYFAGGDERYPICDTLKQMAQPYADHEAFESGWAL